MEEVILAAEQWIINGKDTCSQSCHSSLDLKILKGYNQNSMEQFLKKMRDRIESMERILCIPCQVKH
jgi:hypothetical protein